MKICIPYRQDILKGLELRYSLRSIEKYLTGWTDIILIGDRPDWFKGESVQSNFIEGHKETRIFNKMLQACEFIGDDNFIMWHDDHFLLKHLHIDEIKNWHGETLKGELEKAPGHGGRQRTKIQKTMEIFPEGLYYDVHFPIIFNKESLKALKWDQEYALKSLYCNTFPGNDEFAADLKIGDTISKEFILHLIEGRLFFSTGNICNPMVEVLKQLYPIKSSYE